MPTRLSKRRRCIQPIATSASAAPRYVLGSGTGVAVTIKLSMRSVPPPATAPPAGLIADVSMRRKPVVALLFNALIPDRSKVNEDVVRNVLVIQLFVDVAFVTTL